MLRQVSELCKRFGIPEDVFDRLAFSLTQETVFMAAPEVMRFDAVRPLRRGIRLCRVFPHSVKPTTWAMQVLGKHATRNRIDLDEIQARQLVNGTQLEVEAEPEVENGFVIITCCGFVVGVGLYKRPVLKSQIPKFRPVERTTPG